MLNPFNRLTSPLPPPTPVDFQLRLRERVPRTNPTATLKENKTRAPLVRPRQIPFYGLSARRNVSPNSNTFLKHRILIVSSNSPPPVFQAKTAKGHCRSTRSPWTGRRPGAATTGRDGRRNDREVWNGRLAVPGPDRRPAVTTTRTCT